MQSDKEEEFNRRPPPYDDVPAWNGWMDAALKTIPGIVYAEQLIRCTD